MTTTLRTSGAAFLVASVLLACGTSSSSGGPATGCPTTQPLGGDACGSEALDCIYGHCNSDGTGAYPTATCVNGQWVVGEASCFPRASDGGRPCTDSSECGPGTRCLFEIAAGCSAQGQCLPNATGNQCGAITSLCGCSGNSVLTGCGYPSGFASGPASSNQSCPRDAGGD